MPRVPHSPCSCGCGQAPAETTRSRLVRCSCGFSYRTTRQWLQLMGELPVCPCCSDRMDVPCLLDLEVIGEEVLTASPQYAAACSRVDRSSARAAGKGRGRRAPYRPQCRACYRPMPHAGAHCSCGYVNDIRGGGYYAGGSSSEAVPF